MLLHRIFGYFATLSMTRQVGIQGICHFEPFIKRRKIHTLILWILRQSLSMTKEKQIGKIRTSQYDKAYGLLEFLWQSLLFKLWLATLFF